MQPRISRILLDSLKVILEVLKSNKIPYAVMGGIALQAWGRPRSTRDIDISIHLVDLSREEFISLLGDSGFSFRDSKELGSTSLWRFVRENAAAGIDIEIDFFPADTKFQQTVIDRSIRLEAAGMNLQVVSPEDLIIQKLTVGRIIDLYDARELACDQADTIDWDYLRDCASQLRLEDKISELHLLSKEIVDNKAGGQS